MSKFECNGFLLNFNVSSNPPKLLTLFEDMWNDGCWTWQQKGLQTCQDMRNLTEQMNNMNLYGNSSNIGKSNKIAQPTNANSR